jgi:hypothetical protein
MANHEPDARALVPESPQKEPLDVWAIHHENALHMTKGELHTSEVLAGEAKTHTLLTPHYAEHLKDGAAV